MLNEISDMLCKNSVKYLTEQLKDNTPYVLHKDILS